LGAYGLFTYCLGAYGFEGLEMGCSYFLTEEFNFKPGLSDSYFLNAIGLLLGAYGLLFSGESYFLTYFYFTWTVGL